MSTVPGRHTVHAERAPDGGARLWLDGVRVQGVQSWGLIEEIREPSRLSVTMLVSDIVWGAPEPPAPAFRDDGRDHYVDVSTAGATTPSGKCACSTCGEAWMCSTALRRWEVTGSTQRRIVSDSEADALRRIDATRRRVHELQAANRISPTTAEILLQILNLPAPAVDKSSDAPLD